MSGTSKVWRRLRRLAAIALVLALLLRLCLPMLLGAVARSLAADAGLQLTIGDIDLALFDGRVQVWKVAASRDGERLFALESLEVDVEMNALLTGSLVLRRAEVDGLDLHVERNANGEFALLAGVDDSADSTAVATERAQSTPFVLDSLSLPLRIDTARLQRVRLDWRDEAVSPPVALSAELDVALSDLGNPDAEAKLALRFAAPGAIGLVTLDATLSTQDDAARARADLRVTGIEGESIAPYLAAIGVQPPERSQELRVALVADVQLVGPNQLEGDASLVQSIGRPSDSESSWLELGEVGVHFAPQGSGTDIDLVAKGLAFEAERSSDGRLVVAGFSFGAPAEEPGDAAATPAPAKAEPATDSSARSSSAGALRIASVAIDSVRISLIDRAIAAEPLRLEAELVRLAATLPTAGPARFDLDLAAPGVFESAHLGADFDLAAFRGTASMRVEGLTFERVAAYLASAGLAPSGAPSNLAFDVAFDGSTDAIDAALTGLALSSGAATPVAIERFAVVGLTQDGATSISVQGGVVRAESQLDGAVAIGPLRIMPVDPLAGPHTEVVPLEVRLDAEIGAIDLLGGAPAPVTISASAPGLVDDVKVEGSLAATRSSISARLGATVAGLRLDALAEARPNDAERPRTGALRLELDIDPHVSGGQSVQLELLDLDVDQQLLVAELGVSGRVHGAELDLAIEAHGIEAPQFSLNSGQLAFGVAVTSTGSGGRVALSNLVFGDGTSSIELPLVEFDVPRADDEVLEIARIAATGATVDVRRRADGSLVVAGLTLASPGSAPAKPVGAASAAPTTTEIVVDAPNSAIEAGAATRSAPAARRWPRISIGAIEFELVRLSVIDEATGHESRATARLANTAPWTVYDATAASGSPTPMALRFDAALVPGIGGIGCDITLAPDPAGVQVEAEIELQGIDDAGLVAAWPPLGELIATGGIVDGRFRARATARLEAPRTGPTSFDLRRSTGATIELSGVEFVPTADGVATLALAGLDLHVAPFGAADAPLRLVDVDLHGIRGGVDKRPEGIAIGGLLVRAPQPSPAADAPANPPANPPANGAETPKAGDPAATTGGLLIDRLVVSDFALDFADHSVTPAVFLPIDELELDVRHIAIGTAPRRPVQFRLSAGGGDVELPDLPKDGAFLMNLAREITGSNERTQSVRPWFEELVVSGQVQPGDAPQGWVRTELYGFELTALRGMAEASGVKIGAGTADANVRLDLRGAKGVSVDSRTTFSSLSISEPAGGPISRFLKLPAPLDVVLWALENERSEHIVPLEFSIDHSGVSVAELATQGSKALVLLIADALASSPLRLGGSLLDMVGLDLFGGDSKPTEGPVLSVPFAEGSTMLDAKGSAAVTAVLALLADNEDATVRITHVFSPNDLALAADLALPAPAECLRLALGLEAERATYVSALALKRGRLARLIATGAKAEAEALTAELREAATRLVGLEASLDTLYDLSTEPDERARAKRLREAALHLAERRFESFVRDLVARGAQKSLARIQLARPRLGDVGEDGSGAALVVSLRAH